MTYDEALRLAEEKRLNLLYVRSGGDSTTCFTVRDEFAAKAMLGVMPKVVETNNFTNEWANWCYKVADVMMAARK